MAPRVMRLLLACLLLAPGLAVAQSSAGKVGPLRIETLPNAALLGSTQGGGLNSVAVGSGLGLTSGTLSASVLSVFGRIGAVTLNSSDVTGALGFTPLQPSNNLSDLTSQPTAFTNLMTGRIGSGLTLSSGTLAANVTSVAGRTGAVTIAAGDVSGFNAAAAAAAPVQTVAGRTGAVTLTAADITGLTGLASATAGSGLTLSSGTLAANVTSVAGRTGAVTITSSDMGDFAAAAAAGAPVQSVMGRTGAVTLGSGDVTGALGYTPLRPSNSLSDLASAATARTNLGLGGASLLSVGTTTGTVAAGDDSRITGAAQKASNLSDLSSAVAARSNLLTGGVGSGLNLSGGSLSINFGTGSGTAAQGNDSRITGALPSSGGTCVGCTTTNGTIGETYSTVSAAGATQGAAAATAAMHNVLNAASYGLGVRYASATGVPTTAYNTSQYAVSYYPLVGATITLSVLGVALSQNAPVVIGIGGSVTMNCISSSVCVVR